MANRKDSKNKKNSKKKKNTSKWVWGIIGAVAFVVFVVLFIIGATGALMPKDGETSNTLTETTQNSGQQQQTLGENVKTYEEIPEGHPVVTVEMENGKSFKMELYPEYAPQTVANFVALVESGFYNGVGFHRIVDGFMAQGGDPEGTGMGGSEHNIVGEFASNGFEQNTLSHTRGVVSMARSQDPNSASSQFFICYDDASFLDGGYASFGKVTEGMEVVDEFLKVERTANSMGEEATPAHPIIMKNVTVKR